MSEGLALAIIVVALVVWAFFAIEGAIYLAGGC